MRIQRLAALAALALVASEPNMEELVKEMESLKAQLSMQAKELKDLKNSPHVGERKLATEAAVADLKSAMTSGWLCLCGALVMLMHAGFAMLEMGCCRAKNASNVLLKNLVNVCAGTIGWWIFGWAFAYGDPPSNKFIGYKQFLGGEFLEDSKTGYTHTALPLSWFFQWAFCTAAATIVSGGVAERVKSPGYAIYAFIMASFIYPVVVAWTWGYGWLSELFDVGFMDFAGSGIVHLTGGVSALLGAIVLGPRKGRFETPDDFAPHNLPLVVLGTFILWFGWYGFNPGSTLAMDSAERGAMAAIVAMNTTLSAATGGLTVFALRYAIIRKYDVGGLCNGILAGLVSITAGCGNVEPLSAFFIGLIGAFVYQAASMLLEKLKIDDPVDASPVHGFCGIWGVLAAAIFDWNRGFDLYSGWNGFGCVTDAATGNCMEGAWAKGFGANIIMLIVIIAWAGTLSGVTFLVLKLTGLLRIDEETESAGMDKAQHSPAKAYSMDPVAVGAAVASGEPNVAV